MSFAVLQQGKDTDRSDSHFKPKTENEKMQKCLHPIIPGRVRKFFSGLSSFLGMQGVLLLSVLFLCLLLRIKVIQFSVR
jgi:hypothetical protein